jgi:hypothetical protein
MKFSEVMELGSLAHIRGKAVEVKEQLIVSALQ